MLGSVRLTSSLRPLRWIGRLPDHFLVGFWGELTARLDSQLLRRKQMSRTLSPLASALVAAITVLLVSLPAVADILDYSEDFSSFNTASMSGNGGWFATYATDPWEANGDIVYARTDDWSGSFGSGGGTDNHLLYTGSSWSDFIFDVDLRSQDNDTLGVTFRFSDTSNF